MQPYRAPEAPAYRTVEIFPRRPWWIPVVLGVASVAFLFLGLGGEALEMREPAVGRPCVGGSDCICGFGGKNCLEPVRTHFAVLPEFVFAGLVLAALAVGATVWLRAAKAIVTIRADLRRRNLSIEGRGASCEISFTSTPVLVRRADGYELRAGSQPPIALGPRPSRKGVDDLRALLARLDAS